MQPLSKLTLMDKKTFPYRNHGTAPWLIIFFLTLLSLTNLMGQDNQYHFITIDQTEEYKTTYFCKTLNYYWDQAVVDRSGKMHFVMVDNYKLYCHSSSDGGETWTREQVITGKEGKLYTAMMGLTQDDKRVICYTVNEGFNNGSVGYGSEFIYDTYGAVEGEEGWSLSPLSIHTTNSGLMPYGIITIKDGTVHCILYKYGWYNYGGELHEAIYDPVQDTWSDLNTIKVFNDRGVDNSTYHVGKLAEAQENEIVCVYQRHGSISGKYNLEVVMKIGGVWQAPQILLENNHYSTYNRFDIDYDRHGHTYLGYFEPWGENGPQLYLAHNSISEFEMYEIFEAKDTLLKMAFHPYMDGTTYLYCSFKNELPRILHWSQDGLTELSYLPSFGEGDSADVKRFHYNIPRKNNFSESFDFLAFTNRYNGKEGDYIKPYELVFMKTNLVQNTTKINSYREEKQENFLYPNPVGDYLWIRGEVDCFEGRVSIFSIDGRKIKDFECSRTNSLNMGDLPSGAYLLKAGNLKQPLAFMKR